MSWAQLPCDDEQEWTGSGQIGTVTEETQEKGRMLVREKQRKRTRGPVDVTKCHMLLCAMCLNLVSGVSFDSILYDIYYEIA